MLRAMFPRRGFLTPGFLTSGRAALAVLVLLPCLVELVFLGADHRLWGTVLWRPMAWQYGGFWAGLLHGWQPNYAAQPVTMFLTYSLLHTGPSHLLGNMATLILLGNMVLARVSAGRLLALYAVSALGGALVVGVMSRSPAVMIGASGAVFGLAGALAVWDAEARRAEGLGDRLVLMALGLAGLNLATWWLQGGNLAWQAHLGGTLAGMGFAAYPRLLAKIRS